jgi:hypothetical protein
MNLSVIKAKIASFSLDLCWKSSSFLNTDEGTGCLLKAFRYLNHGWFNSSDADGLS